CWSPLLWRACAVTELNLSCCYRGVSADLMAAGGGFSTLSPPAFDLACRFPLAVDRARRMPFAGAGLGDGALNLPSPSYRESPQYPRPPRGDWPRLGP